MTVDQSALRLLIVDDSNLIRRSIQREIGEAGHDIRTAGDGVEALRVFDEFKPDIVTMDITMPKMDGLTCVEEMLARDEHAPPHWPTKARRSRRCAAARTASCSSRSRAKRSPPSSRRCSSTSV